MKLVGVLWLHLSSVALLAKEEKPHVSIKIDGEDLDRLRPSTSVPSDRPLHNLDIQENMARILRKKKSTEFKLLMKF